MGRKDTPQEKKLSAANVWVYELHPTATIGTCEGMNIAEVLRNKHIVDKTNTKWRKFFEDLLVTNNRLNGFFFKENRFLIIYKCTFKRINTRLRDSVTDQLTKKLLCDAFGFRFNIIKNDQRAKEIVKSVKLHFKQLKGDEEDVPTRKDLHHPINTITETIENEPISGTDLGCKSQTVQNDNYMQARVTNTNEICTDSNPSHSYVSFLTSDEILAYEGIDPPEFVLREYDNNNNCNFIDICSLKNIGSDHIVVDNSADFLNRNFNQSNNNNNSTKNNILYPEVFANSQNATLDSCPQYIDIKIPIDDIQSV